MPTSLLEIVDLGDGKIVLQRADENAEDMAEDISNDGADGVDGIGDAGGDGSINSIHLATNGADAPEPLLTIQFSDEARMYIMDQGLEVAKAMIQAGIQAAANLAEQAEVEVETSMPTSASRVLH